jgi:putative FmdB family regulatory protein
MPVYEYKCADCRVLEALHRPLGQTASPNCRNCGVAMKRKFSFALRPILHEHYNPSVGQVVSSHRQHKALLREKSDEMAERLGMDVNYQPIDPREAPGVTEEGLEATNRRRVNEGRDEVKLWL